MMLDPVAGPVRPQSPAQPRVQEDLWRAAQDLEAAFLAEMLRHAGAGTARSSFGGGAGEEQFSSFLRTEQARAMAQSGGIGLAQSLFEALVAQAEGTQ